MPFPSTAELDQLLISFVSVCLSERTPPAVRTLCRWSMSKEYLALTTDQQRENWLDHVRCEIRDCTQMVVHVANGKAVGEPLTPEEVVAAESRLAEVMAAKAGLNLGAYRYVPGSLRINGQPVGV